MLSIKLFGYSLTSIIYMDCSNVLTWHDSLSLLVLRYKLEAVTVS